MKRLSRPDEPLPDAYKPPAAVEPVLAPIPQYVGVGDSPAPDRKRVGRSLSRMKSYRAIQKSDAIEQHNMLFELMLPTYLGKLSPEKFKYDSKILKHFLNEQEKHYYLGTKKERDAAKQKSRQLLLPYFNNDPEYLQHSIDQVWKKVFKSNILRRLLARLDDWLDEKLKKKA